MNIIRTTAVELSTIPAIAYKQKLASGGAGIRILRLDQDATAIFTIDKRTGDAIAYGTVDHKLFPADAVHEALELTSGLPYSARGKLAVHMPSKQKEKEDVEESETDKLDMVDSDEYKAIVERYLDEKGKLNYHLMNKDFIQFAAKSSVVAEMVARKASAEEILYYIVQSRAALFANKKEAMTDQQTAALIETLNEMGPRSAFKELNAYIRHLLARP